MGKGIARRYYYRMSFWCLSIIALPGIAHANVGPQPPPYGLYLFVAVIVLACAGGLFLTRSRAVKIFSASILLLLAGYTALLFVTISRQPPQPWNTPRYLASKNLESVRSALTAYAADSETNRYPVGRFGYDKIRDLVSRGRLPESESEAGWKEGSFSYLSEDGTTYKMTALPSDRR